MDASEWQPSVDDSEYSLHINNMDDIQSIQEWSGVKNSGVAVGRSHGKPQHSVPGKEIYTVSKNDGSGDHRELYGVQPKKHSHDHYVSEMNYTNTQHEYSNDFNGPYGVQPKWQSNHLSDQYHSQTKRDYTAAQNDYNNVYTDAYGVQPLRQQNEQYLVNRRPPPVSSKQNRRQRDPDKFDEIVKKSIQRFSDLCLS